MFLVQLFLASFAGTLRAFAVKDDYNPLRDSLGEEDILLTAGTKLGPYEIQSPLGAGGMGEVYRARDTRLDRTVAIKVLASHLSASLELKQRMEREARAISSLNHSHICQLYDIGSQDGTDFLVMEFLVGETLASRLHRGALPLNEVFAVGMQVAQALEVAHRHGFVHRDLKPGNIMLTPSGAKLMDFGLAKPLGAQTLASGSAPSFTAAPTMSGRSPMSPLTTAGSIVGTIQYMAPEQIEGKEADARSDIFSFGAVLYEMTTGKRAFEGKSQISVASSILEKDPEPLSVVKPVTPPAFQHVVTTCLQKNPEDRFQTAHDVRLQLKWIAEGGSAPAVTAALPTVGRKRERLGWTAGIVAAAILGAIAGTLLYRPAQSAPLVRTVINAPENASLRLTGDFAGPPVLSPDGKFVAFTAAAGGLQSKTTLWVRPMDKLEAQMLAGTEGATFPFWSPDSRSLGFFADNKLRTVDLNGGAPLTLCDANFGRGGTWGPDGVIVFTPDTQKALVRISANGGTPTQVTRLDLAQHTSHRWPFFLPDGKHFLYLAIVHDPSKAANNTLYYASLDGRENRPLFHSQSNAIYANGFLLFARGSQLMAQAFDPTSGTLSGDLQSVANGMVNDVATWHMDVSASGNGLLVMGSGGAADWQLVWMDRSGKQIGVAADKLSDMQSARLSPQGDRIAFAMDTGQNDVWVLDLARGIRTRLTFGPVSNTFPVWSPDGKWIIYNSDRNGHSTFFRKASDGSGAEELLLTNEQIGIPSDWSRDGKYLIYASGPVGYTNWEIWALPLEGERKPRLVVPHGANGSSGYGRLSPDGRWLAYASTESGKPEVYVVPFGGGQGRWQVSADGGSQPAWSQDGKELYYASQTFSVVTVPVKEVNGIPQFGSAQTLTTTAAAPNIFFDVTPDGKKVLLPLVSQQVNQSITVVTNWTAGLKK
jgi:eukaryotic-like serine/threonine-protein kinase